MPYEALTCPRCGAAAEAIPDRDVFFCRYCGAAITKEQLNVNISGNVTVAGMASVASLLERGYLFLEDGEYYNADKYFERVLDIDPKCSKAYLGKILAKGNSANTEDLVRYYPYRLEKLDLFQKALRYADDNERKELMALKKENIRHHAEKTRNIQNNLNNSTKQLEEFRQYFAVYKFTEKKYNVLMDIAKICMVICALVFFISLIVLISSGPIGLIFVILFGGGLVGTVLWRKSLKKKRADGVKLEAELKRLENVVEQAHAAQRLSEEQWTEYD